MALCPMIDLPALQALLRSLQITSARAAVVKLAGDASNRAYYRISWEASEKPASLILMVLADPEPFKQSEEAVSGAPLQITELPFINIQRHLATSGVPVPDIVHYDEKRGWILLEDLGDITLAQALGDGVPSAEILTRYYQKAIDVLIAMQRSATPTPAIPTLAHSRVFDHALYMWEFDHFIEYGIEKREGILLPERTKCTLRALFSDIALQLAALPLFFTHRDYHSRNLMVQYPKPMGERTGGRGGRGGGDDAMTLSVIDFQDALMGPCQYDLASLLRDSYIDLPEEVMDALIGYYRDAWEDQTGEKRSPDCFREQFNLVGLQRNLKAAGRFVYIDQVKKNPHFLPYVSPTLLKVKRNIERNGRLKQMRDLLADYVKEWQ